MTSFAGYELEKELGRGATATVYQARSPNGVRLCLKIFHPGQQSQTLVRRIEREAELASDLRHPHIIRVQKVLQEKGGTALAMDWVDGEDLQSFQGRFPYLFPELALWVGIPLLRALEYAHERDIVHRDLKPANVLVGKDGSVKVTDFGLARVKDSQLTQTSHPLVGTVDYMAPEQARGDLATSRSDLYCVGAILYFLTTGAPPVSGTDTLATLKAIADGAIEPPQERNPKISSALSRLLTRAMASDPAERYGSAAEFRQACESYLQSLGLSESRMTLGDWMEDPSTFTLEALKTSAEHLTTQCERHLAAGQVNEFLETLAHLSLKAPSSPALVRLNEAFSERRQKKRGWLRWSAGFAGCLLLVGGVWLRPDRTPSRLAPFGPPAQLASLAPLPVAKTKAPAPQPAKPTVGSVRFEVDPAIRVFWEGRSVDTSRPLKGLKPGEYFVLMEKEGFAPIRERVKVKADEETVIRVR